MISLNKYEIADILNASDNSSDPIENNLRIALQDELRRLEELESMNFDECEGGACKL